MRRGTMVWLGRRSAVPWGASSAAALTVIAHVWASAPQEHADATPPNVVIVMTDDQRWDTVSKQLTPNVYKDLVANGITA